MSERRTKVDTRCRIYSALYMLQKKKNLSRRGGVWLQFEGRLALSGASLQHRRPTVTKWGMEKDGRGVSTEWIGVGALLSSITWTNEVRHLSATRHADATRFNDPHIAKSNCVGASSVNLGSTVSSMYEVMRGNLPSSIVIDSYRPCLFYCG